VKTEALTGVKVRHGVRHGSRPSSLNLTGQIRSFALILQGENGVSALQHCSSQRRDARFHPSSSHRRGKSSQTSA